MPHPNYYQLLIHHKRLATFAVYRQAHYCYYSSDLENKMVLQKNRCFRITERNLHLTNKPKWRMYLCSVVRHR